MLETLVEFPAATELASSSMDQDGQLEGRHDPQQLSDSGRMQPPAPVVCSAARAGCGLAAAEQVPVAGRVTDSTNDGTLWCERPSDDNALLRPASRASSSGLGIETMGPTVRGPTCRAPSAVKARARNYSEEPGEAEPTDTPSRHCRLPRPGRRRRRRRSRWRVDGNRHRVVRKERQVQIIVIGGMLGAGGGSRWR